MGTTVRRRPKTAAWRAAFELLREGVFLVAADEDQIVDVNRAGCELLECSRRALIGATWSQLRPHLGETTQSRGEGGWFVAVAHGRRGERTMRRDPLTGLADRGALSLADPADRDAACALLFVDLDQFKTVNDTHGHLAGDRVLRVMAQRLVQNVRPGDCVVRYGGDEFLVLVRGMRRPRDLNRLAGRMARELARPIEYNGQPIELSASIGVARRSPRCQTIESLIAAADRAMYQAKARRRALASPGNLLEQPS